MNLTMASVWFSVIVIICTKQVFAYDEDDGEDGQIFTCDQCIRVGNFWCSEPMSTHCASQSEREDGWCKIKGTEILKTLPNETTIKVGTPYDIDIVFDSSIYSVKEITEIIKILKSTQNMEAIDVNVNLNDISCNANKLCSGPITITVEHKFCMENGTNMEYFSIEIPDGNSMKEMKYHVPCACECSLQREKDSFWCHKHGDFACGVCMCHKGWTGKFCNQVKYQKTCEDRGDIMEEDSGYLNNGLNCSGNGRYGHCDNCICDENLEGAQYFSQSKCGSICQLTNNCDTCILNGTAGRCSNLDCPFHITIQTLNKSLWSERDIFNRKVWVHCNVTVGDCNVKYTAMSRDNVEIFLMVEPCAPHADPYVSENVSMALGIVALILLVAAAAGVVMWKHLHSVPPLPSTDMQYHNIDAEDCTGVNPLYIDPCSSFKNPMYGK